jgi:RNA-splicing ligase RtcB
MRVPGLVVADDHLIETIRSDASLEQDVAEVVHRFGISTRVARLKPLAVIKG